MNPLLAYITFQAILMGLFTPRKPKPTKED